MIVFFCLITNTEQHPFKCLNVVFLSAMSKAAVKISGDLLSNPLCEQDQAFLESMTALDTAMKRMDAFNQEKVRLWMCLFFYCFLSLLCFHGIWY